MEGERWTPRLDRAVLLGRREVDDGCAAGWEGRRESGGELLGCWAGETRRERAVLLGGKEVDDGCAAGRGQDC